MMNKVLIFALCAAYVVCNVATTDFPALADLPLNNKKCKLPANKAKIKKCTEFKKTGKKCKGKDFPDNTKCIKSYKKTLNDCIWWGDCNTIKAERKAKKVTNECPTDTRQCTDVNNLCSAWAANGECTKNGDWMQRYCSRSCCPLCNGNRASGLTTGVCPTKKQSAFCLPDVQRSDITCNAWSKKKECKKNANFMLTYCMSSCCKSCKVGQDRCPTVKKGCKNSHKTGGGSKKKKLKAGSEECRRWASLGQCQANPRFMNKKCPEECCPFCRVNLVPVGQQLGNVGFGGYNGVGFPFGR